MPSRPPGRDSHMYPPALQTHDRQNAIGSFDGRDPATGPDTEYPVRTGDTGVVLHLAEAKRPYSNFERHVSFLEPETGPPFGSDRVKAPRRFGKDVMTTLVNGHIPLPCTGDERPTTYKDRNTAEQRVLGRESPYKPKSDPSFTPLGINTPLIQPSQSGGKTRVTKAHPPPAPIRSIPVQPPPRVHIDPGQPLMKSPTMDKHDESEDTENKYRATLDAARAYIDRINNKAKRDSTGDRTEDISFTISKDSSADESVRNAKLLADMGERSQRHRIGNDTELRKAKDGGLRGEGEGQERGDWEIRGEEGSRDRGGS